MEKELTTRNHHSEISRILSALDARYSKLMVFSMEENKYTEAERLALRERAAEVDRIRSTLMKGTSKNRFAALTKIF